MKKFFEPWEALQSMPVKEPPNVEGLPEDQAVSILEFHSKSVKESPWFIWGTGMVEPARVHLPMSGSHAMTSDRRIVGTIGPNDRSGGMPQRIIAVKKPVSDKPDAPSAEEIAKRIVECVNALAGCADPVTFVNGVLALLVEYTSSGDERYISLLCQFVPPAPEE